MFYWNSHENVFVFTFKYAVHIKYCIPLASVIFLPLQNWASCMLLLYFLVFCCFGVCNRMFVHKESLMV